MYVCIWLCWVLVAVHRIFNLGYGLKDLFFSCGIQFPDQGSTPGPLHWKHSLSHWTTRENLAFFFSVFMDRDLKDGQGSCRNSLLQVFLGNSQKRAGTLTSRKQAGPVWLSLQQRTKPPDRTHYH